MDIDEILDMDNDDIRRSYLAVSYSLSLSLSLVAFVCRQSMVFQPETAAILLFINALNAQKTAEKSVQSYAIECRG